jgi:hypothetical protein
MTTTPPTPQGAESELEYGCVRCQAWHGESDGPVYAEHLISQSKHGLRRRPKGGWPAVAEPNLRSFPRTRARP